MAQALSEESGVKIDREWRPLRNQGVSAQCNKGTKRVRGVQPQISVRAAAAERVDNSTAVTLRLFLHRDVTDKSVQTD